MEQFDALDKYGNPLGFRLVRGESIPKGIYFGIVTIVCYSKIKDSFLVTKRNPNKPSGNLWEITGGGIQASENALAAARRELGEETGIWLQNEDFKILDKEADWPFVCHSFVVSLKESYDIKLDPKETIDYMWLDRKEFLNFIQSKHFVSQIGKRILNHKEEIKKIINN